MPEVIETLDGNGFAAAAKAIVEALRDRHGIVLRLEDMPDFSRESDIAWLIGRKWFDLPRLKREVTERDFHLYTQWDWDAITDYLAERISRSSFYDEDGRLRCSPRCLDPTELIC